MRQAHLIDNSHPEGSNVYQSTDDAELLRLLSDCSDDDLKLIDQVKKVFPGAQVGMVNNET